MKNVILFTFISVCLSSNLAAQRNTKIFTSDIGHFWNAYDSIRQSNDFSKKLLFINKLYINKGTKGLKAFMQLRDYNDTLWVKLIDTYPKFWNSIRQNTLSVAGKKQELEDAVKQLRKIYPDLKDAEMYFTVGGLRSGGTVKDNMVLVGTEIATGNAETAVAEFKSDWLKNVFKEQTLDNIVFVNIHEYIHTQQQADGVNVLAHAIKEGACDFIAELVLKKPLQTKYLLYGKANAAQVKADFRKEMFSRNFANWLYNGSQKGEAADLGYYVGYEICKAYYQHAKDKKQAVKEIIELQFDDETAVENFLQKSNFYPEKIDKKAITEAYNALLPTIVELAPFKDGALDVDASIKEIKITFSKPMMANNFSISFSEKGKAFFPLAGVKGYENDDKTLVLKTALQPQKEYEFLVTNKGFKSKDGYPLKETEYLIKFTTK